MYIKILSKFNCKSFKHKAIISFEKTQTVILSSVESFKAEQMSSDQQCNILVKVRSKYKIKPYDEFLHS